MTNREFLLKLKRAVNYDYIDADLYNSIEDYQAKGYRLDGRRSKRFVRMNGLLFSELINELQRNPKTSYITYANQVIKEGYIPTKLSCMIKKTDCVNFNDVDIDNPDLPFKEALASRILNLYECPTAHNIIVKDMKSTSDNPFVSISVDMVSNDIVTFEDFRCRLGDNLAKNIRVLQQQLPKHAEKNGIPLHLINQNMPKIIEDYAYSYLIRRLILRDGDFFEENCGLLVGDDQLQFVNFDYESSLNLYGSAPNKTQALNVVRTQLPNVYKKFSKTTKQLHDGLDILVKDNSINWIDNDHRYNIKVLKNNVWQTVNTCRAMDMFSLK